MLTREQQQKAVELLCETVETVTVNPPGDEEALAQKLCAYLRDVGIPAEIQTFAPGRANVTARLKGRTSGPALLLNGHLDTVPFGAAEAWASPPEKACLREGRLYGRGVSDMKSGLCAALFALCLLAHEGFVPKHDIVFLGTGDEESQGLGAQAAVDAGILRDVGGIVIGEPTGNHAAVASKGTLWLECTVRGKTSHGAYPQEGVNAVETAFELFSAIRQAVGEGIHPYLMPPTCTLTKISGGVKVNMIPDLCQFSLDIRTVPGLCHDEILRSAQLAAEKARHSCAETTFEVLTDRAAMETDPQLPLVRDLRASIAACGLPEKLTGTAFFSDASIFLKHAAIPTVLFGPGESSQAHKPNESLCLKDYLDSAACYRHFLMKQ